MRKFSLLLLPLLTVLGSYGQSDQKFHFGLKAAPSICWMKSDTKGLNSDGSKIGFVYGLITEFNFAKNYAFSTGIEVAYRGGKFKQSFSYTDTTKVFESDNKLQYIELPLTLKLKTNEIGLITYYLQAGISPAFNIRARQDVKIAVQPKSGSSTNSDSSDIDIKDDINAFNINMVIGGGVEYSLSGNTALQAGLTFSNGLLDVLDGSGSEAKTNYIALTIAVLF